MTLLCIAPPSFATNLDGVRVQNSFNASWTPNFAACGGTHAACLCGSSSYTYTNGSTTSVCIKP